MQARILGIAEEHGMIQWPYGTLGGAFSPVTGAGDGVAHGRKGKGILLHRLIKAGGLP
jgi:hypothetical protein